MIEALGPTLGSSSASVAVFDSADERAAHCPRGAFEGYALRAVGGFTESVRELAS